MKLLTLNTHSLLEENYTSNGGLGRLATCFLDSIATFNLSGDGIGLSYHLGLFKQKFENHLQKETKNAWIQNPN